MGKKIIWTPQAEESFKKVLSYLKVNWTEKELLSFINKTEIIISYISNNPKIFRNANDNKFTPTANEIKGIPYGLKLKNRKLHMKV